MKKIRRLRMTRIFVLAMTVAMLGTMTSLAVAMETRLPVRELESLVGENLSYDIGFLWFERLAEAHLSFQQGKTAKTYEVVLDARTLGVAAWLTGHRRQRYMVTMELGKNGALRTLKYSYLKSKGEEGNKHFWTKTYIFDYDKNNVDYIRGKDGKERKRGSFPLNEVNPPADILTVLYNFRTGVYGKTMTEKPLVIPTFARGKALDVTIGAVSPEREYFRSCASLFKASVDKDVFDTGGGFVYACFDEKGRPWKGIVENVLGLGDVWGSIKDSPGPAR